MSKSQRSATQAPPPPDAPHERRGAPSRPSRSASHVIEAYPHHDEAERAVLGALILDSRCAPEVASHLSEQDLYRESARYVWRAIFRLLDRAAPVDALTLCDELHSRGELEGVGGPNFIASLPNEVVSVVNVSYYARLVREASVRRQLIAEADHAREVAFDPGVQVGELLQATQGRLSELVRQSVSATGQTLGEEMAGFHRGFMQRVAGKSPRGMSTGFAQLDEVLGGGLHLGRALLVAGHQKSGKSKAVLHLGAVLAEQGAAVEHWATEMTSETILTRLVSRAARMPEKLIRDPLSVQQRDPTGHGLSRVVADLGRGQEIVAGYADRWRIYTSPAPKLAEIVAATRARLAELRGERPLVLIIDYVQEIEAGAKLGASDAKRVNAELAAKELVALCNQTGVIGLFVAHLNRDSRKATTYQEPNGEDIFASAAWAKATDYLLTLWSPFGDETPSKDPIERQRQQYACWIIQRSRYVAPGRVHLRSDMARNLSVPWEGDPPDLSGPVRGHK